MRLFQFDKTKQSYPFTFFAYCDSSDQAAITALIQKYTNDIEILNENGSVELKIRLNKYSQALLLSVEIEDADGMLLDHRLMGVGSESAPITVEAQISEGTYETWTMLKKLPVPDQFQKPGFDNHIQTFLDERTDALSFAWEDKDFFERFAVYDLTSFEYAFLSAAAMHYPSYSYTVQEISGASTGCVSFERGGKSRSILSYLFMTRADAHNIEVWQGGATPLWLTDIQSNDAGATACTGEISMCGKYLCVSTTNNNLLIYKGA